MIDSNLNIEFEDREDIKAVLSQWNSVIKQHFSLNEDVKNHLHTMFENLGFSNIAVNTNGKVDGDKDGSRYSGLSLSGMDTNFEGEEEKGCVVITQEVTWENRV